MPRFLPAFAAILLLTAVAFPADDGFATYRGDDGPYHVHRTYPKLSTPQWVGEEGVEAVVVLAIDDMRGPERWEAYLRPILERLKKIDGRAPVSIMTCQVDPKHEHLQKWLKEGVSLETHTFDHPCPLLRDGDFAKARATYEKTVDLMAEVPHSKPVAFRTPCCDSLNTVSPRIYSEIFNRTTARGNFLTIDSSVFNLFTANDPELPRDLVLEADGTERFRKYLPADRDFVNYVEDYPYPYVIGWLCWQFPCVVPSDWSAQHRQGVGNPKTLADWKAALDATVIKKGVFCLVFHPYNWARNEQIVDLIDHAVAKHGKKVKFLTFREAQERLDRNLLGGQPLRHPKTGADNGVRLVDRDGDGYLDVEIRNDAVKQARLWRPGASRGRWEVQPLPDAEASIPPPTPKLPLPPGARPTDAEGDHGLRFFDLDGDGHDDVIFSNERDYGVYLFDPKSGWTRKVMAGKQGDRQALPPITVQGHDNGFFVHGRSLYWQNEQTSLLKDLIARRSFNELVGTEQPTSRTPEQSLRLLKPRPGFVAELAAAEPLVQDPIAMAFGPDGKLWVTEMGDYPLGIDGKGKPGGRVKYLEDLNGDGKYDRATIFLDNVPFPTGVLPWRRGVLVTAAPDILYAEDTDGDGKADKVEVLYTGFVKGNQQHRVNGLTWGVDGWAYGANGDSGGQIKSVKTEKVVDIRGRDFRLRPDTGEFEATTGQTQYGRCTTDWGDWFGGNNSNPLWHFALDDHYLRRNPHLPPPEPRINVPAIPGPAPVFPLSRTLTRFNDFWAFNRFTSACSPIVYRDDLFGPAYVDNTFVCEPVHNLVHREVMSPRGTTFASRRPADEERSEFLASVDNWFRPTMVRVGPDGCLYVCDMYRHVIEHPEWVPLDWQKKLDLRAGHDMGRIYRIAPVGVKRRPIPRLDRLDTAGLVAALDSPSGWQRDMAQMLLLWRADRAAVPLLEKMATDSPRPQARLHALCTLGEMGALQADTHRRALKDAHPGVRRHAVRLCEGRRPEELVNHINDPDPQVRLQVAYSLGEGPPAVTWRALGQLARAAAGDRYLLAAVLSSVNARNFDAVLGAALSGGAEPPPGALVENLLRMASALATPEATGTLLKTVGARENGHYADWQFAALATLLDALDARNASLAKLIQQAGTDGGVLGLFDAARATARDPQAPVARRRESLRLLGRGPDRQSEDAALLAALLVPQTPDELQTAAVAALGRLRGTDVPALLLRGWRGYGPALRGQVLEVLARRDEWLRALLGAVEQRQVPASEVDAVRRQRLVDHRDGTVRERARKLFAVAASADRQKVIEQYASVAKLPGDAARGQAVFVKTCSTCHKLAGVGNDVGPDLGSLVDRSTEALLPAVLDPNRAVETRYVSYIAETKNGLSLTGVLTAETATSITLVSADGKPQVILRTDLESLTSTGRSAMPEGLEKDLTPQAMADLFVYLRGASPAPKRKVFEGNTPEVVKPGNDGVLRLTARNCSIYGRTLVLEAKYGNLGYWESEDDHASWTVVVTQPGRYEVTLDYACDTSAAGKEYVLQAGSSQLTGQVAGTGTWDNYRQTKVGTLELSAGEQTIVMRPRTKPGGAMIDLRLIRLVPVGK